MSVKKSRIILLLAGMVLGVVGGVFLGQWLGNSGWSIDQIRDIFRSDENSGSALRDAGDNTVDTTSTAIANQKKPQSPKILNSVNPNQEISLDEFLALYGDEYPDSVLISAYEMSLESNADDITVIKDELINIRLVEVDGLEIKEPGPDLDSILLDERGGNRQSEKIIKVEFWKSPINYQGYKWDKKKLILFGFFEYDLVRILHFDGFYYMKSGKLYYLLEQRDAFTSALPVGDEDIINALNDI